MRNAHRLLPSRASRLASSVNGACGVGSPLDQNLINRPQNTSALSRIEATGLFFGHVAIRQQSVRHVTVADFAVVVLSWMVTSPLSAFNAVSTLIGAVAALCGLRPIQGVRQMATETNCLLREASTVRDSQVHVGSGVPLIKI